MANQTTFSQLNLPVQAAPVDRAPGWAAMSGGPGVEAAAWYDDLWAAAAPAIPGILGGLAGMI